MRSLLKRIDDKIQEFEESRAFPAMTLVIGLIILYTMITAD